MSNQEKQADELLVLQSIFDDKLRLLDNNQLEISVDFELTSPIDIQFNNKISQIHYLPPLTFIIQCHDDYPSDEPPSFFLSCFYFSNLQLAKLCQTLDEYPFNHEVCVYDWIDLIKNNLDHQWNFDVKHPDEKTDPRALNGYSNENLDRIYHYLINYDQEYRDKQFQNQLQTCLICTETLSGTKCYRLHRCGHFYCQSCLNHYVQSTLKDGKFGERLVCPQDHCQQPLLPTEIKAIVQNDELYDRYERITLQTSLASMNDIVWCPRCESAVIVNEDENDKFAMCGSCRYSFCRKCRETFHSQTMCRKEYLLEQLRMQQEKERQRLEIRKQETLARLAKAEREHPVVAEKEVEKGKYKKLLLDLNEEYTLLEEVLNAERIDLLNTQPCPNCHVRIEKNGGCSQMYCTQCKTGFTWEEVSQPTTTSTILKDSTRIETLVDELYQSAKLEQKPDSDSTENKEDLKVAIDNRSVIGSAMIRRIKICPRTFCEKKNVKIGQDNWMVCSECMNQYCFHCGRSIRGAQHFERKCQRYTPV